MIGRAKPCRIVNVNNKHKYSKIRLLYFRIKNYFIQKWMLLHGQSPVYYNDKKHCYVYRPRKELDAEFLSDLIAEKLEERRI